MTLPLNILNNTAFALLIRGGLEANLSASFFSESEPGYTTDTKQMFIGDGSNNKNPVGNPRLILLAVTANDPTASIPAGYCIDDIFIRNTTANAVTGGLKIGTSAGGTQIATTIAVGANAFIRVLPGTLTTSGPFSPTAAQSIFIEAVTSFNSASLTIIIFMKRAIV